jgi:thioredoxin-related protein
MKINPIDKIERIKQTYKKETLSYIYVDDNEIIKQKYQVEGYPVLLLFNKKGQIIKRFDGYKPEFKMNYLKEVNEIINQETL